MLKTTREEATSRFLRVAWRTEKRDTALKMTGRVREGTGRPHSYVPGFSDPQTYMWSSPLYFQHWIHDLSVLTESCLLKVSAWFNLCIHLQNSENCKRPWVIFHSHSRWSTNIFSRAVNFQVWSLPYHIGNRDADCWIPPRLTELGVQKPPF